ncbi:MAG: UvrD-helicase domain-containing protein [Firmicutes bacterium]|nr:UvrD-helicase domain-containing protein [Bacillota bacterium]
MPEPKSLPEPSIHRSWTREQWDAITAKAPNLLVSAAAGSGKTSVLVERVIRQITEGLDGGNPVDVDRLLVVTFTDSAAAEMRQRVGEALLKLADIDPGNERVRRQLMLLNKAQISTMHSFCLSVLRQNFHRAGLDPGFRVMDEDESSLMLLEAVSQVFEEGYQLATGGAKDGMEGLAAGLAALADRFGGDRGDEPLQDIVLSLYRFSRSQVAPGEWLRSAAAAFDVPPGAGPGDLSWARVVLEDARMKLEGATARLARALELAGWPGGPAAYISTLEREVEMCVRLADACASGWWQAAAERFREAEFGRLRGAKSEDVDESLKDKVKALRDSAKVTVYELRDGCFGVPFENLLADIRGLAPHMDTLVRLVMALDEAYSRMKKARALLDFNDLEHYCLALLVDGPVSLQGGELAPSDIAIALRSRFEDVLVDEYQDINAVQDAILRLAGRSLFMVGDVKQSIYRFRLAEPRLFMEKRASYMPYEHSYGHPYEHPHEPPYGHHTDHTNHASGPFSGSSGGPCAHGAGYGAGYHISLSANFRSRKGIVDGVNFVFRQILNGRVGEVSYDRSAELVYNAQYPPIPGPAPAVSGPRLEPRPRPGPGPGPGLGLEPEPELEPEPGSMLDEVEIHLIEGDRDAGDEGVAPGSRAAAGYGNGGGSDRGNDGGEGDAGDSSDGPAGGPGYDLAGGADDSDLMGIEELQALELEAGLVGACIHRIVGRGGQGALVWDKGLGEYRPATFRDIAVLLRATRDRANVFLEVFRRMDIPAYAELGTGYFVATEVQIMLSLLQVIDNPRQDIPLAAVLKSPIVGLSAAELAEIRITGRTQGAGGGAATAPAGSFYDAVVCVAGGGAGSSLPDKLLGFLQHLEAWRTQARRGPLSELISRIFRDTRYLDIVGGMPGGAQRQANLRALYEKARQFDQFARPGLFRFLRHVRRLQDIQGDIGAARALGENEDVVRIMSIHKSKGLEFPVVIVADLGKHFNLKDLNRGILFHRDLGLGPVFVDPAMRIKRPTIAYRAIRERLRLETLAEELRVLYVAMTRAREKLILVGSGRNLAAMCEEFGGESEPGLRGGESSPPPLPDEALAAAGTFLDWICMATMRGDARRFLTHEGKGGAPIKIRFWSSGDVARLAKSVVARAGGLAGEGEGRSEGDGAGGGTPWDRVAWDRIARLESLSGRPVDPGVGRELERRLNWVYPHTRISRLAAKASVSELKRMIDFMVDEVEGVRPENLRPRPVIGGRPAFLRDRGGLTAAERGTVTHLVLQHLDLGGPSSLEPGEVARQIGDMVRRELLTPEQAREVDARAIAGLFAAPLGRRLVAAARRGGDRGCGGGNGGRGSEGRGRIWIMRELPFSMRVPVSEILDIVSPYHLAPGDSAPGDPNVDSMNGMNSLDGLGLDLDMAVRGVGEWEDEYIMVQGIIDCLVHEDDGFLLVDFKTDHLPHGLESLPEMADRYREQIRLYARAVEKIYGEPVKQAFLYFLSAGRVVEVGLGQQPIFGSRR